MGRAYSTMREYTTQSGAVGGGVDGWDGFGAQEQEGEDEVMGSWGTVSEERVARRTPLGRR